VVGVDFAADMLKFAEHKTKSSVLLRHVPITWFNSDVVTLPFPDNSFDACTMGYGLRNVTDRPRALREIYRVLKRGKKAAILDFNRPDNQLISSFQRLYLDNIVVPAASEFGVRDEYAYIMKSLEDFPTGPEQEQLALSAGFSTARHHRVSFGLMGCLVVTK